MAVKKNNMDTIFEQDKHMLTFMEGVEKGELDYHLAIDNPTRVYKAHFEKNEDDNFVLKFSLPEGDKFNAEYFFSNPAVLFVPNKIQILELRIKQDDEACGKSLEQLNLSGIASISCVYRQDQGIIPNGKTVLQDGDKVLLVTTAESMERVTALFRRKRS